MIIRSTILLIASFVIFTVCNPLKNKEQSLHIDCISLSDNASNKIERYGFRVEIKHLEKDPQNVNRIYISDSNLIVEILPSKGFSLGEAFYKDRPIFWEPPFDMVDPEKFHPNGRDVAYKGRFYPGSSYVKSYCGGIELLGLSNWGMNYRNKETGKLMWLHGETSNIPVENAEFTINEKSLTASGSFLVRDYEKDSSKVWYKSGDAIFKVTRTITLTKNQAEIYIEDKILNISDTVLTPDIGYHINFYPEKESEIFIPSKTIAPRNPKKPIPEHFDIWPPLYDFSQRLEVGVLRRNLMVTKGVLKGEEGIEALIYYPDGTGISVATPYMPYYQSWVCSGGKGNTEFSDSTGQSILIRNWDGIGIEFGSSSLDHKDNLDPAFNGNFELVPDACIDTKILIKILDKSKAKQLKNRIDTYNVDRKFAEEQ